LLSSFFSAAKTVFPLPCKKLDFMSKKFILPVFIFSFLFSKAQFTEPGQKVVGGGLQLSVSDAAPEYNNPNYSLTESRDYGLNFSYGTFKRKNVLQEVTLGFNHSKRRFSVTPPTNIAAEDLHNAFYATYGLTWFKPVPKKLYFGVGGSLGPSYSKNKYARPGSPSVSENEVYQFTFQIFPLLAYQVSNRFLIDLRPSTTFLSAGYRYAKSKNTAQGIVTSGHQRSFNLNTGFFSSPLSNLGIGFKYLLK
jgi:hypothetical protein